MKLKRFYIYLMLAILIGFFLFPIFWMVGTALKPGWAVIHDPPYLVPPEITFANFQEAIFGRGGPAIWNSIIVGLLSSLITVGISIPAAYSLSRLKPKWSNNFLLFLLSLRFLPPFVTAIGLFFVLQTFGLLNTYIGVAMAHVLLNVPIGVWLLKGFFDPLPRSIEESAIMDGCGRMTILRKILLPIAKPAILITFLFCFLFSWNEFIFASFITHGSTRTIPVVVSTFVGEPRGYAWGVMASYSVICIVPALMLALLMRKYALRAFTYGVVKG